MSHAYRDLVSHYESCLERHGDSHLGVDWPRRDDAERRYDVMLGVIRPGGPEKTRLLDFGCGASHLYEYLRRGRRRDIAYHGLDLSPKFVALSRAKFPENTYYCLDILRGAGRLPRFDYVVMNGLFTQKRALPQGEMFSFLRQVVRAVFKKADRGIAFNVMSPRVDWRRRGAFHLPFDRLSQFLTKEISRNFVLRHDYGMYEYTAYVYK